MITQTCIQVTGKRNELYKQCKSLKMVKKDNHTDKESLSFLRRKICILE